LVWFCRTGQQQRNGVVPFLKALPRLPSVAFEDAFGGDALLVLAFTPDRSHQGAMDVIVKRSLVDSFQV
jgi:hypothetical protein